MIESFSTTGYHSSLFSNIFLISIQSGNHCLLCSMSKAELRGNNLNTTYMYLTTLEFNVWITRIWVMWLVWQGQSFLHLSILCSYLSKIGKYIYLLTPRQWLFGLFMFLLVSCEFFYLIFFFYILIFYHTYII